ncbi:PspC domain-containing protein [Qipengyuania sp. JC766]|uniref:PspC domain-containing protein n=1 Tax=Qipengyuania sp. JC766 TaxID=3232139 RepID=UPI00345AD9D8
MNQMDNNTSSGTSAKQFRLDREDNKIWGVCGGIANYLGVDPMLVRVAFAAGTLLGFGSLILVYILIALVAD